MAVIAVGAPGGIVSVTLPREAVAQIVFVGVTSISVAGPVITSEEVEPQVVARLAVFKKVMLALA